jgi:hypothetical protein
MLRDLLRRVLGRREPSAHTSGGVTLVDVGRELLVGTEASAQRAAAAWARRVSNEEADRRERQRRTEAAQWLRERVEHSPGRCWFPSDECDPYE